MLTFSVSKIMQENIKELDFPSFFLPLSHTHTSACANKKFKPPVYEGDSNLG